MNQINMDEIGWAAAGRGGAIATGGAAAAAAGRHILEQGGRAADAAVATILALSVTDYGLFAIGGEVPFMIYDAQRGAVRVLCGQGRAPLDPAATAWYMQNGIPSDGDIKSAAVPGAVDLCLTALRLYGCMSLAQVAEPVLSLLDAGFTRCGDAPPAWYPHMADTLRRLIETERACPGSREDKLQAAADRFYRGDIAAELEAWYIEQGSFIRRADLAAHVTTVEDAVTVHYRGFTVCKCGPWTQGPTLCQALRLLEEFDLKEMPHLSADYIHAVIESLKLALADRDAYYGDPAFVGVPLPALLSDAYTALRRPLIDMQTASHTARPGDPYAMRPLLEGGEFRRWPGGTTTCVVADRWGNMVAATPSCNFWDDQINTSPNGISHGTRLTSLNTTLGHPNCIQPGKRPRITLTPTLMLQAGRPVAAISVAGGDQQDQTTLNVLLNWAEFGMLPQMAVTAPRFATNHYQDSFDPSPRREEAFVQAGSLILHADVPEVVRQELARRGHQIQIAAHSIADPVMIYADRANGMFYAAGDPAAGRHAIALDS